MIRRLLLRTLSKVSCNSQAFWFFADNIGNIVTTRNSFLAACSIMTEHPDPTVRAEAISCAQQVHLFAARHVNLSILVPQLCVSSPFAVIIDQTYSNL